VPNGMEWNANENRKSQSGALHGYDEKRIGDLERERRHSLTYIHV